MLLVSKTFKALPDDEATMLCFFDSCSEPGDIKTEISHNADDIFDV